MRSISASREGLSELDRPNSYIGKAVPRPNLDRLMHGRGLYVSDIELPRMGHVVFLRSPHAHARIVEIDSLEALHGINVERGKRERHRRKIRYMLSLGIWILSPWGAAPERSAKREGGSHGFVGQVDGRAGRHRRMAR